MATFSGMEIRASTCLSGEYNPIPLTNTKPEHTLSIFFKKSAPKVNCMQSVLLLGYAECSGRERVCFVFHIILLNKTNKNFFVQFCCFICYYSSEISISSSQNTIKSIGLCDKIRIISQYIGDSVSDVSKNLVSFFLLCLDKYIKFNKTVLRREYNKMKPVFIIQKENYMNTIA